MIIVVGNTKKGGSGKSTVATNLAADLQRAGKEIQLLDLDPENTASQDFADARKYRTGFSCDIINNVAQLSDAMDSESVIIIDIGGLESDLTAAAIAVADILFIPFRISSKDLKALSSFAIAIEKTFEGYATPDLYLVPNFLHPRADRRMIEIGLHDLIDDGYKIATMLTNRQAFIDSADNGQSVTEFGDMKAAAEIRPLVEIALKAHNEQR